MILIINWGLGNVLLGNTNYKTEAEFNSSEVAQKHEVHIPVTYKSWKHNPDAEIQDSPEEPFNEGGSTKESIREDYQ